MVDDARDILKSCWQSLRTHLLNHVEKLQECRACGRSCTWFSDMCENCGTKDPVMLPMKYLWATAVFAVVFLMLTVWWC